MHPLLLMLFLQTAAPQAPAPTARDYVVGPSDVLAITVFGEPDLSGRFTVDSDGTFDFRLIGRVKAAGLTVRQIEELLQRRLADGYLVRPQVSVEVEQYRSQTVYVMGEVRNPGTYPLTGGMTILDLIARAGSLTPSAGTTVLIHRPRAGRQAAGPVTGSDGNDEVETIRLSVRDLQTGRAGQGLVLRDGDTIFVPKAATFYVTGHVRTPGPYVLDGELTVMQALSLAGGVTERGAANRVKIIRIVGGRQREIRAKPTDLVQPGDTIHVPQRFF